MSGALPEVDAKTTSMEIFVTGLVVDAAGAAWAGEVEPQTHVRASAEAATVVTILCGFIVLSSEELVVGAADQNDYIRA